MEQHRISKTELQNYLINRSFLQKKAKSIEKVLAYYSCIQVDPINAIARSHEISLWNRVENFTISSLYEALYKKRELFEYWLQLYSIIPLKYFPFFAARMHIKEGWQKEFYRRFGRHINETLEFVKEHGAVSSKDLSHIAKVDGLFNWTNKSSKTALLEYLWDQGDLMISFRKGNLKYYDLSERELPGEIYKKKADAQESIDFYLKSYFRYTGVLRKSFINRSYRKLLVNEVKERLGDLIEKGEIIKLDVDGVRTEYFMLKEQLAEFESLKKRNRHEKLNILSPLDPLIIDRRLIHDVFDFDYTWEAYTPAAKRKFAYYGMPVLFNGKFIGQIELAKDKRRNIKLVKSSFKVKDKRLKGTLKATIKSLESFVKTA